METYVLVPWPECQEYMEYQWFYKEAIPATGPEEETDNKNAFIHFSDTRKPANEYL
jgi:hypothetical protein